MEEILVSAHNRFSGKIYIENDVHCYSYDQNEDVYPVSLTMPLQKRAWEYKTLHPVFEANLPEGFLFEVLRNLLLKRFGTINDFLLLSTLGPGMKGHLTYECTNALPIPDSEMLTLEEVIQSNENNLFDRLLKLFLHQSGISGVHPKVMATLSRQTNINFETYIVKTFGNEFPCLAENEFFCLKIMEQAGIQVPEFYISDNKKLLILKRFDIDENDCFLGFEEVCVLQGKNKIHKYKGSYEGVAKTVGTFTTNSDKDWSLKQLFKQIVMSFLLKNGDAHLKNFGILYTKDTSKRYISPAYDIVCTTVYIPDDPPALTLFGRKAWLVSRKRMIEFGERHCILSSKEANSLFDECMEALHWGIKAVDSYIKDNPEFREIGDRIIRSWKENEDL